MTDHDGALLLLRICFGVTMAAHGYSKLFMGAGIAGAGKWFSSLGLRPGSFHAWLAALTEIGAGIALALGLFTPFASAAFVALMLVAGWTVHRSKGFFIGTGGWEYTFIMAVGGIAIAVAGPGHISMDWVLFSNGIIAGWAGLTIAVAGGLLAGVALLAGFYRPQQQPS
ncbi:putative oxidoreductase [Pseudarthrobacter sp. W1I19]|uniref:DoxX family protein n=1 Tax=Pseudarthrobacter sp. W1I19 TaxID=3042288 RepID=UPI00278827B4|nr:DoxX family protein [Pseudarthrobacter sp. W1I19]MDQ0923849.1 putative oxidoreductase [Pseudarthrobacter sp. W1I19]